MSLGEKLTRRMERPPLVDPWFGGAAVPGYSQPSAIDNTGYTVEDPLAERGYVPAYDDPTVHVVPGGALGEAGAGWRRSDDAMPQGEYIGPVHISLRAPMPEAGVVGDHAWSGLQTGLGSVPDGTRDELGDPEAGPTEYQGGPRGEVLSDSDVYHDLYGSGREFGLDEGGDPQARRMVSGRRLRSDDPGYS